jgi:hypothetical protein
VLEENGDTIATARLRPVWCSGVGDYPLQGVTPENITAITKATVERAKAGDLVAARLLMEFLVGPKDVQRWPEEAEIRHTEVLTKFIEGGQL